MQIKAQTNMNLFKMENATKNWLAPILETLNHCRSNRFGTGTEDANSENSSTLFLQIYKNQLIDLQEHFERYCNALPVFGWNNARYDMNLIMGYLLSNLVSERDIESIVIKKSKRFVSFKFGNDELLDISKVLGGATKHDLSLKG